MKKIRLTGDILLPVLFLYGKAWLSQNLTYFPYKKEKRRKLNMKKRNEKRSLDRVTGRKR